MLICVWSGVFDERGICRLWRRARAARTCDDRLAAGAATWRLEIEAAQRVNGGEVGHGHEGFLHVREKREGGDGAVAIGEMLRLCSSV